MKARRRLETARLRIAREAARIMAEQGLDDFRLAKQKAAARLGNPDSRQMPGNAEIQEALVEYQELFLGEAHTQRLRQLRRSALEAMRLFEPFAPRLVGPVLEGSAGHDTVVSLHLFADLIFVNDFGLRRPKTSPFRATTLGLKAGRQGDCKSKTFR